MNVARSSLKLMLAEMGGAVVLFVGLAYFAQQLGPRIMGSFFLFRLIVQAVSTVSDFGIRGGVEKRISEGQTPGSVLATGITLKAAILAPIAVAILLLRGPINQYIGADLAGFLIIAVVLREVAWLYVRVLRGELRVGETAVLTGIRFVLWISISGFLVFNGGGLSEIVFGYLVGFFGFALAAFAASSTKFGRPSTGHARSLIDYSKYGFVSSVGGYAYNWLDVALIGFFLTQTDVGIYEYAWQITIPVLIVTNAVSTSMFPQVSQWSASSLQDRIESLLSNAIVAGLFVTIPAFAGVVVLAEPILRNVYGPEFVAGASVLVILMFEKSFRSAYLIFSRAINAIDRPDISAKVTLATVGVGLVLNVLLIPPFGLVGAAVATASTFALSALALGVVLTDFFDLSVPYRVVGWCVLAAVLMGATVSELRTYVSANSIPRLAGLVAVGVIMYVAMAVLIPDLRRRLVRPGVAALLE